MRYAGPVISERERIVDQAQAAVLQRSRGPELTTPLGEMVEKRLAETAGLEPETVAVGRQAPRRRRLDHRADLHRPGRLTDRLVALAAGGARADLGEQPRDPPRRRGTGSARSPRARPAAAAAQATPPRGPGAPAAKRRPPSGPPRSGRRRKRRRETHRGEASGREARDSDPGRRRSGPSPSGRRRSDRSARREADPAERPRRRRRRPWSRRRSRRKRGGSRRSGATRAVASAPLIEPTVRRNNGRVEVPSWSDVLLGVQAPAARGAAAARERAARRGQAQARR